MTDSERLNWIERNEVVVHRLIDADGRRTGPYRFEAGCGRKWASGVSVREAIDAAHALIGEGEPQKESS